MLRHSRNLIGDTNIIIIKDTREQNPLEFDYEFVSEIKREKLSVGDYQAEFKDGTRPPIIFERKGLSDLFGTLGKGYKRYKKEIERANQSGIRLIMIIEKPMMTVLKGYEKSDLSGESIVRKLFTLFVKYGVYPVFCKDRDEVSRYIYEFYCAIGRMKIKKVSNAELSDLQRRGDIPVAGVKARGDSRGVDI